MSCVLLAPQPNLHPAPRPKNTSTSFNRLCHFYSWWQDLYFLNHYAVADSMLHSAPGECVILIDSILIAHAFTPTGACERPLAEPVHRAKMLTRREAFIQESKTSRVRFIRKFLLNRPQWMSCAVGNLRATLCFDRYAHPNSLQLPYAEGSNTSGHSGLLSKSLNIL